MKTAWEHAADIFDPPTPKYMSDPVAWAQSKGEFPWSKQREILESVRDNPTTAVKSCHSSGKSFTAALVCCWWLDQHPPGEAMIVTSAPTGDQVKAILWREIGRMHKRHGLAGRTNLTEWYINGEIVGIGRKPNDYEPTAFQGIHAKYLLVVLDEACGIPKSLWEAADSLASNLYGRILAIGNPDDPTSEFAAICSQLTWNVIKISAFDTPNLTGEEVPTSVSENIISKDWVERKGEGWGTDSPVYISKVLGEFPQDRSDGVIPGSFVAKCRRLELPVQDHDPIEGGLDPARGGDDKAVLWVRQGPKALKKWEWVYTPDPKDLAEKVLEVALLVGLEVVKIDADGLGWGVSGIFDQMRDQGLHTFASVPVYGSATAQEDEFLNVRAEVWWRGRERSRLEEWDLSELDDDDAADLTAPRYFLNAKGKIQIEKKEDLKKRLGRSPDSGDALLLAFEEAHYVATGFSTTIASINILGRR